MDKIKNIVWQKKYEIGNFEIDSEHEIFVRIINKISDAYSKGLDKEYIESLISELLKYAEFHFCSEENLMKIIEYPSLINHQEEHKKILTQLNDKICAIDYEFINYNELMQFCFTWFVDHTRTEDKKLAKFLASLASKKPKTTPCC